ncbi:hypothetical protein DFH07DRAFT_769889 [Mycena maculata]|uniref:Uncharacterized protein n=1 Tax=Mycena maculata TaxID=230809 RepID=A0AAD7JJS3_9AGAR|nr:hypothetical protein DFH07DRAFT_769889 [Mycena maculata]
MTRSTVFCSEICVPEVRNLVEIRKKARIKKEFTGQVRTADLRGDCTFKQDHLASRSRWNSANKAENADFERLPPVFVTTPPGDVMDTQLKLVETTLRSLVTFTTKMRPEPDIQRQQITAVLVNIWKSESKSKAKNVQIPAVQGRVAFIKCRFSDKVPTYTFVMSFIESFPSKRTLAKFLLEHVETSLKLASAALFSLDC